MSQTTIQKADAIKKGSVKIQVGDSFSALTDIGAIRDPQMTLMVEPQNIEFDNVDDLRQFAEGDKVQFSFLLAEINLTNLSKFDKGLVNLTSIAGSATPVTAEAKGTGWTQGQPIKLNNKNGANTIVGSIVVKSGVTTLTLNTDYRTYVGDGSNGELGATYIVPITTNAGVITVDYSYTPNASKKITFTKTGTKTLIVARITNTDANGKVFKIDIQNVTNIVAPVLDFPADDEAEVQTIPVTLEGYIVEITDEQQITA
jgi:hypothetical protein